MPAWTRRATCRALAAGIASTPLMLRRSAARAEAGARLEAIERTLGGRLGVSVRDEDGVPVLGHRADERFPLCSTFKVLAAAAVLARVDAGQETLDRPIAYRAGDLLDYAPVTREALEAAGGTGRITVADACAAAIVWSDNTAANLLLTALDGPEALTAWLHGTGDAITRLDRTEPGLNTAIPGDPRDTTTPDAMRGSLGRLLLGDVLSPASRDRLEGWMVAGRTGFKRLRAGLPPDWRVGDKTGSGDNGTVNDVAILRPPGRAAIVAAVYATGTTAPAAEIESAYAGIGRTIAGTVGAHVDTHAR